MTHDEILNGINAIPVEIDSINIYSITINDKRFITTKGKYFWKKPQHAMAAFTAEMKWVIKRIVRENIVKKPDYDGRYYAYDEYIYAYDEFKKYLIDNQILKIIKYEINKTQF